VDPEKPSPKLGVGILKYNCDGRLVVTRNGNSFELILQSKLQFIKINKKDNMPNCLWIWDVIALKQVALIQQLSPIQHVMWNPLMPESLAYSCGGSHIYIWAGETVGCDAIEVPAGIFFEFVCREAF
jgi:hypothetical protein